jgi:outer membrane protein TolC
MEMNQKTGCAWWTRAMRIFPGGALLGAAMILATAVAHAGGLSLADAEAIALEEDPSLQAVSYRRDAMQELAVASDQWPDPMLKMGFMSLPTDTWKLGQEPMTQVQVGVIQKFPRGRTRELRAEQMFEQSEALAETLDDTRLRILLAVREDYVEVLKQRKLAAINADARSAFADLADITQDYYATGRVQQQDVLRAAVELARVEDRATRIAQEEDRARERLGTWIGDAAYRELAPDWPELGTPPGAEELRSALAGHPLILALQQKIEVAETGVELADQRYKPEFGIDLTYGGRGGSNMDGSSRSDLFSIMLMMDLPLFHENRQDRYRSAAVAEASAVAFQRDDTYRRMRSEIGMHAVTLARQLERLRLFEESLLPDASFNAEAAFSAYQAALESLTTLMRARITEYDLQLEYASLRAETLKTMARLRYFEGEKS